MHLAIEEFAHDSSSALIATGAVLRTPDELAANCLAVRGEGGMNGAGAATHRRALV